MKPWSMLLCRIGRHDMTYWRRVPSLAIAEQHCKRAGCTYHQTRVMTARTPLKRRQELRAVTESDATQGRT